MQVFKKAVIFLLINLLVLGLMTFALTPPATYELKVEEFLQGDYDSLVIGSSYANNIDPRLLPDGDHAYNLTKADVPIIDYLYLVRELHKHRPLKRVYMDICVPYWTGELGDINRINMMKLLTGTEKLQYLREVLGSENYNDLFFRYEVNGNSLRSIPKTIRQKLKALKPEDPNKKKNPSTQGFYYVKDKADLPLAPESFSPDTISDKSLNAFRDLVDFCREENIQLIAFQSAFQKERLHAENLNDVHDYFTELLGSWNVPFYDLNYVKWELFPRPTEAYSDMDGHMLGQLAQSQSRIFAKILTSSEPEQYFETDYQTLLNSIP